MSRMDSIGVAVGLVLLLCMVPAAANDIATRVMSGLNGGARPGGGGSGGMSSNLLGSERGGEEHKIDQSPRGVPPLLVSDYEPGDTFSVHAQSAKLFKPDGSWVLLTYHGRWQAAKLYSNGRRVDLNRVSGEVLYDSKTSMFARH